MHSITKHDGKKYFCRHCFSHFNSNEGLNSHMENCIEMGQPRRIVLPKPGEKVKFKNYQKGITSPFVIYADLECILPKTNIRRGENTLVVNNHVPCGYAYRIVCRDDPSLSREVKLGRGEDSVSKFIRDLVKTYNELIKIMNERKKKYRGVKNMIITEEQKEEYEKAVTCHICNRKLCRRKDKDGVLRIIKVRDHCHFTGKYRGPAHKKCNLLYRQSYKIPVIFHNLRGYDGKFLLTEMGKISKEFNLDLKVIPTNEEKFLSITLRKLVFIDSFQFMFQGLDKLVKNLVSGEKDGEYKLSSVKKFCDDNGYDYKLLVNKGIYPYEYMDSFKKFGERELPGHNCFFSKLTGENVSEKEYARAAEIFSKYCGDMWDYHDLYLKMDVLLLSEVFEEFRGVCKMRMGWILCMIIVPLG